MRTVALLAIGSLAALAQAPQPAVSNAHFETIAFTGNLAQQMRASGPAWFGYAVKSPRPDSRSCCWNNGEECGCSLEGGRSTMHHAVSTSSGPVQLEGTSTVAVLYRIVNNTTDKIRVFSLSCPLDAGGLPFTWITGVPVSASVAFLKMLPPKDEALMALSQHDGTEALETLVDLAKTNPSTHVRSQALFWLAMRAGERAAATITNAIENDPDTDVKKRAVFALSQLPKDEAVPKLIAIAQTQRNPEVRKQAFFWLGQTRDPRALAFIEQVLLK
jgi:hypothetical protein